MKDMIKLVLSLGLVCCIGSGLLVWVCGITQKPIQVAEERALRESLQLVLPEGIEETVLEKENPETTFYKALDKNGKLLARAAVGIGHGGFGGDVKVVVGFDLEGSILGVMVTEHSETPGVGTKATDRKVEKSLWDVLGGKVQQSAKLAPNGFLDSFTGRKLCKFSVRSSPKEAHEIQGIAGATYSSKAVVKAINAVYEDFEALGRAEKEK